MDTKLEIGTVVKLKSGGPLMTICAGEEKNTHDENITVWAQWFTQDDVKYARFVIETLEVIG
jgi:uncharacterized protein YodC (DUF2158 family)